MLLDDAPPYRKSSFCAHTGCVEVAPLAGGRIALRDSKNPGRPAHVFTADEWDAFLSGVRNGEFDRSAMAQF